MMQPAYIDPVYPFHGDYRRPCMKDFDVIVADFGEAKVLRAEHGFVLLLASV